MWTDLDVTRLYKVVFAALVITITFQITETHADQHDPIITPPEYRPSVILGWAYANACRGLNGSYVNNNPNFYQGWSCEGIDWCVERPETYGCNTTVTVKPLTMKELKDAWRPKTKRIVYTNTLF